MSLSISARKLSIAFVAAAISLSLADDASESHFAITLSGVSFSKELEASGSDLVVIFCDGAAQPCDHLVNSFRQLTTIWKGTGRFLEARFGEVDCAHDKDVCANQG